MADQLTGSDQALIFPVGHYLGPFYPGAGAELRHHGVRIGTNLYRLDTDQELAVWGFAHGVAGQFGPPTRWTRAAVESAHGGGAETAATLDRLLERELVVEVMPGTPDAAEFAGDVRLRALLMGTGHSAQHPGFYGIGPLPNETAVLVPAELFELWEWGPGFDDLWAACELFAAVNRDAGATDASRPAEPAAVLDALLPQLHVLLAAGAAYLDEAAEKA